jgi:DNA invertase Pin-like site-specific DNA recombinase
MSIMEDKMNLSDIGMDVYQTSADDSMVELLKEKGGRWMNAVIYARRATDEEQCPSTTVQIDQCRTLAMQCGYDVAAIYEDCHGSATVANTPQFTLLRANIIQESSSMKAMIIINVDWIARNVALWVVLQRLCKMVGIKIITVHEKRD